MKNNNNIDQLFESKLNNQSFELKDSYMADFESKLDIHNKKGKGYFWLIFALASISLGIVYDFVILPNFNTSIPPRIASINTYSQNNSTNTPLNQEESKFQKETSIENPAYRNSFDLDLIENKVVENKLNRNKLNKNLLPSNSISNRISTPTQNNNRTESNIKDKFNQSIAVEDKPQIIERNKAGIAQQIKTTIETNAQTIEVPDVYIDDTIRRQVIVIDTIVRKDTIIITDTIKRKFRLFKKKT